MARSMQPTEEAEIFAYSVQRSEYKVESSSPLVHLLEFYVCSVWAQFKSFGDRKYKRMFQCCPTLRALIHRSNASNSLSESYYYDVVKKKVAKKKSDREYRISSEQIDTFSVNWMWFWIKSNIDWLWIRSDIDMWQVYLCYQYRIWKSLPSLSGLFFCNPPKGIFSADCILSDNFRKRVCKSKKYRKYSLQGETVIISVCLY